ncbi:MAG: O-antigen ligase family protein, partial [Bacteroidota bacterium]
AAITGLVVAPLLVAGYIVQQVSAFYDIAPIEYAQMDTHTEGGEKYNHHKGQSDIENGHYVWTYVAVNELEAAWEQRSHLEYSGKDLRGQHLRATLIRFLASKGLRKDAAGVAQLSQKEVKAIEQGVANVHRMQGVNLETRIDEIIGEFDRYLNGGNPQGNSVTQRLEFWKAGWGIVCENPFIGIGTGDVKQAYQQQYEATNSLLESKYRLRAHNQFLTILVAFGCIGLLWFLVALLYPVLRQGQRPHFFYWVFLFIALLSMLNEDTLETQVGVTFFAFFNCLFLFGWKRSEHLNMIPDHNASIGATIMRVMKAS